jgi:hypothetical protein
MARTALTPVQLAYDTGVAQGATGTVDAVNGNIVSFNSAGSPATFGPFQVVLVVTNADTVSHNIIIRGSGYTGTASGAANSGIPSASNTVFTQSTLGDLTVTVANASTSVIGPFTTDRFVQPNHVNGGDLWLDWSASTSMSVWVYQLPTDAI